MNCKTLFNKVIVQQQAIHGVKKMDNKALDLDNKKSFMAAPTYPLNMGTTFQLFQRQPRAISRAQPQLQ